MDHHFLSQELNNQSSGQTDLLVFPSNAYEIETAGFWIRFAAFILDYLIIVVGVALISLPVLLLLEELFDPFIQVLTFVGFLYFPIMESSKFQATLGKKVTGLVVTDLNGQPISFLRGLGRFFSKIVSTIILYIGFIMIAFTDRNQGLHDIMAGTLVIYKPHVAKPLEQY